MSEEIYRATLPYAIEIFEITNQQHQTGQWVARSYEATEEEAKHMADLLATQYGTARVTKRNPQ